MEALSILERVERLEKLAGVAGPAICPDPTGEGSAWQVVARSVPPVGWIDVDACAAFSVAMVGRKFHNGLRIAPDPSIPWGEKYEAILPEEAEDSDEGFLPKSETVAEGWYKRTWILPARRMGIPWRRRKPISEPAPGSDAEHPPLGYVLVPNGSGEKIGSDWISWSWGRGPWESLDPRTPGERHVSHHHPMARPIPANEGDSQKEVAELRATVERLTAENAAMDAQRNDAIKSRNQYRKELEELEEKMDAIKELAG